MISGARVQGRRGVSNGRDGDRGARGRKGAYGFAASPGLFIGRPKISVYHHCWQELAESLAFGLLKLLQILSVLREIPLQQ